MGMFDTVVGRCPKCQEAVDFQSKAGECTMERYYHTSVPPEIASDIDQDIESCPKCGFLVRIKIPEHAATIPMVTE